MIQNIFPDILYNQYTDKSPKAGDYILIYKEKNIFIISGENDEDAVFPAYKDIFSLIRTHYSPQKATNLKFIFLFSINEHSYFIPDIIDAKNVAELCSNISAGHFVPLFNTRGMTDKTTSFAISTGWQLYDWYRNNAFCGRCGEKTALDKSLRMIACPKCKNQIFPKIVPAVIVGVTNGDKILLTKYAGREYTRYALIAGFVEIGETPEQTVAREVMEEAGIKVKNIRYYKSQPWGYESDLLLGYFCDLDGDDSINIDKNELSVGEWVHYSEVQENPDGLSLTGEMMDLFRTNKGNV